jgi:P27 family predicted phage terminase small subunit
MSRGNRGGRPRKPTAVKKRQGNPGRRPLPENEPVFQGGTTPPKHLDRIARNEWRRLAPRLIVHGMLTPADRAAFSAYCVAYSTHVRAEEFLAKKKTLAYKTPGGVLRPWPEIAISNQALGQMYRFLTEFGLTPSSRSRLDITIPKKGSSDEDFLFGDGESPSDECKNDVAN